MNKIKISLFSIVFLFSLFSFNNLSFAKEDDSNTKTEKLSKHDKQYLIEKTGHTEQEVNQLPVEVAKQLVKDKAVLKDSKTKLASLKDSAANNQDPYGAITPLISASTMSLWGTVYQVTSDRPNDNKYYIYGNFQWYKAPNYTLRDKMTFGFPSYAGFYLPTGGGQITQHQHRYSQDPQGNGNWIDYGISYAPSDWDPNAGVAGDFNLLTSTALTLHKGYMGQYVYVPKVNHGTINIKIEYGHQWYYGTPTVSVFPAGLGITPTSMVDTASYALTLYY